MRTTVIYVDGIVVIVQSACNGTKHLRTSAICYDNTFAYILKVPPVKIISANYLGAPISSLRYCSALKHPRLLKFLLVHKRCDGLCFASATQINLAFR